MTTRFFTAVQATKAAMVLLAAAFVGQANAAYTETDWGRMSMSYYALNTAPYRIAGYTQDRKADGDCVYMRARQYSWGSYPLYFGGYTRTCTGAVLNWSFDTLYPMDVVDMTSDQGKAARVWQR